MHEHEARQRAGFERLDSSLLPEQPNYAESIARRFKADPLETASRALEKIVMGRSAERKWQAANRRILDFSASQRHEVSVLQIGANDGVHNDPLRPYFEQFPGWSGVLVEPNPHAAEQLGKLYNDRENIRIIEAAISNEDGTGVLYAAPFTGNGKPNPLQGKDSLHIDTLNKHFPGVNGAESLVKPVEVRTLSLSTLLHEAGIHDMDFLSIDTEGHDKIILDQLDFEEHRPQFILYENIHMTAKEKTEAESKLSSYGYQTTELWRDTFAELG